MPRMTMIIPDITEKVFSLKGELNLCPINVPADKNKNWLIAEKTGIRKVEFSPIAYPTPTPNESRDMAKPR